MITYRFSTDDLLRIRFAISPLLEATASLWALHDAGERGALHLPWIREVGEDVERLDLGALKLLTVGRQRYVPDFIAPPPETPLPDVDAELERVRHTPRETVRAELAAAFGRRLPTGLRALGENPRRELPRLVASMRAYWEVAMEPHWDRIRRVLEDDIRHRAAAITAGGAIAVFDHLHPQVSWSGTSLSVHRDVEADVELGGRGLQLVPSVFMWPRCGAMYDPPWQPAVLYPPRGVGLLWEPAQVDPEALGSVLGRGRARVLAALDAEISTTELARRLAASPGGVSEHLGALRRAGLVQSRRERREVLYARTAAGDALVRAPSFAR